MMNILVKKNRSKWKKNNETQGGILRLQLNSTPLAAACCGRISPCIE
jgi:hypothetical protein